MKMSGRHKTHLFIISAALIILFLVGPPAAFASKLPTVCNIFAKKNVEKAGACGHRAFFTKIQDRFPVVEAALFSQFNFEPRHLLIIKSNHLSGSSSFGSNPQSNPLRC
jgi:hypothetical protein